VTAADEIRRRGWHQCSIAADPLRERLLRDELLRDVSADDLLIIATQDCDLCHSFETEPYAEIVIGRRVDTPDGNCRFGKNPRRLQFELSGTADIYEVQAISRISIPRDVLAEYVPDSERDLERRPHGRFRNGWESATHAQRSPTRSTNGADPLGRRSAIG
jgi:hypothetical protein